MKRNKLVADLTEVRQMLLMDTARFNNLHTDAADRLPTTEAEVTEFIRRRTQLWRETYLIPVIENAIKELTR